jgi:hypothetical protein
MPSGLGQQIRREESIQLSFPGLLLANVVSTFYLMIILASSERIPESSEICTMIPRLLRDPEIGILVEHSRIRHFGKTPIFSKVLPKNI